MYVCTTLYDGHSLSLHTQAIASRACRVVTSVVGFGGVLTVSFISRFLCIASTGLSPESVLYIQVLLYNIHWVGFQECPLYPGSTVIQFYLHIKDTLELQPSCCYVLKPVYKKHSVCL